jgi:uncharacterized protein (TIGR03000 family)
MFRSRDTGSRSAWRLAPVGAALLLVAGLATAGDPTWSPPILPWNRPDHSASHPPGLPWTRPDYSGYFEPNEPWYAIAPARRAEVAKKYQIHITPLPAKHTEDDANRVLLLAHLPEDAQIWFDDAPTRQRGRLRTFVSPPLTPGRDSTYTVRVAWREDGRWVEQMHAFPVHAGDVQCIDIIPSAAETVQKEVKANLAKLAPEDRKVAEAQGFCVVQEGIRLGSMGVPVKVMVKGQPVFVCCEGCVAKALDNPARTLAVAQELGLKVKNSSPPRK